MEEIAKKWLRENAADAASVRKWKREGVPLLRDSANLPVAIVKIPGGTVTHEVFHSNRSANFAKFTAEQLQAALRANGDLLAPILAWQPQPLVVIQAYNGPSLDMWPKADLEKYADQLCLRMYQIVWGLRPALIVDAKAANFAAPLNQPQRAKFIDTDGVKYARDTSVERKGHQAVEALEIMLDRWGASLESVTAQARFQELMAAESQRMIDSRPNKVDRLSEYQKIVAWEANWKHSYMLSKLRDQKEPSLMMDLFDRSLAATPLQIFQRFDFLNAAALTVRESDLVPGILGLFVDEGHIFVDEDGMPRLAQYFVPGEAIFFYSGKFSENISGVSDADEYVMQCVESNFVCDGNPALSRDYPVTVSSFANDGEGGTVTARRGNNAAVFSEPVAAGKYAFVFRARRFIYPGDEILIGYGARYWDAAATAASTTTAAGGYSTS